MAALQSINPATDEVLRTFEPDGEAAIEEKLAAASAALPRLRALGFDGRARLMVRTAELLEAEVEETAGLITAEMGKPIGQSRAEVLKSAKAMRFYAEHAEDFLLGEELEDPSVVGASAAYTEFEPIGVVLAVMPWNYPIWQVVRFAAPALMAGNAGLLKHASCVPQAAAYLGALFARAGFPEGAFATLMIGSSRVEEVLRDDRVAAATLTGSEGAGRAVAATAGDSLKKTVLELGGSDPFIVMPSARLEDAVSTAVQARTSNNGQACINAKRFIVHADVYDRFVELFAERMGSLAVGEPTSEETQIGPLANAQGLADIEELVEDARAKGAEIRVGGYRIGEVGCFYAPTVVDGLTPEARLWREEAFGPVASVFRAESLDDALALANDSEFGLGSAFWSEDDDEIVRARRELEAGAVFVNGMTISYPELPFGGVKKSGYGRELSKEGIREFCNLKTVWVA